MSLRLCVHKFIVVTSQSPPSIDWLEVPANVLQGAEKYTPFNEPQLIGELDLDSRGSRREEFMLKRRIKVL